MYAATGEGWFNIDAVRGNGIFKSTDGGNSWSLLPSTVNYEYVQDLVIDSNGNVYASLRNLVSTERGVMRSTNGGTSWTQVLGAPLPGFTTGRASDLEAATNGDIYAALGIFGRSVVMKSSFAIHGLNTGGLGTWTNITPVTPTATQRTEILRGAVRSTKSLPVDAGQRYFAGTEYFSLDQRGSQLDNLNSSFCIEQRGQLANLVQPDRGRRSRQSKYPYSGWAESCPFHRWRRQLDQHQ